MTMKYFIVQGLYYKTFYGHIAAFCYKLDVLALQFTSTLAHYLRAMLGVESRQGLHLD